MALEQHLLGDAIVEVEAVWKNKEMVTIHL